MNEKGDIMDNDRLARFSQLCVAVLGGMAVIYIALRYLMPALLPILAAFLISSVTRPAAKWVARKSGMPQKVCGGAIAGIFVFFSAYAIFILGGKLAGELMQSVRGLINAFEREDNVVRRVVDFVSEYTEKLPYSFGSDNYSDELYKLLSDWVVNTVTSLSERLGAGITTFLSSLPRTAFAVSVCVIAVFYLTSDFEGARRDVEQLLPKRIYGGFAKALYNMGTAASGYIKAYLSLTAIIFCELFFGFLIIGVKYSFLVALLIAAADILPVIGVGTVLVPWALISFMCGSTVRGAGILVLFSVIYITRQIIEVRLVGRFMGLHPLLTLCGAFAGYSLFGLWGLVLSPMLLYLLVNAVKAVRKND